MVIGFVRKLRTSQQLGDAKPTAGPNNESIVKMGCTLGLFGACVAEDMQIYDDAQHRSG